MLLQPLNYFFSLQLVPVFEWEHVDSPDGAPAPPVLCEGASAPELPPDAPSDLRLVFKGYEWRPIGERSVFPREDWESIYRAEADAKEDERDPVAQRNDPSRRHVPPPRPMHDISPGMDSANPALKSDTSDSD